MTDGFPRLLASDLRRLVAFWTGGVHQKMKRSIVTVPPVDAADARRASALIFPPIKPRPAAKSLILKKENKPGKASKRL